MNSTSITPYSFENNSIRVIEGDDGEPRFVAADICKALDITNVGNALARLDDDEKDDIRLPDATGRMQQTAVVTESGMYSLILRSDKPAAKRFKKWITHEVIPSIRKTGSYLVAATPAEIILLQAQKLVDLERAQKAQAQAIKQIEARQGAIEDRSNYYQVQAFARLIGKPVSTQTSSKIGKIAAKYSREHNLEIKRDPDPRYTWVNLYHTSALEFAFAQNSSTYPLFEN